MNNAPTMHLKAIRIAYGHCNLPLMRWDLEMLACLYEAKKRVTINYVLTEFNPRSKPRYSEWNDAYYRALDKLVSRGLAELSFSLKGYRSWRITLAGRIEIEKLNEAALKILEKWEEEGR